MFLPFFGIMRQLIRIGESKNNTAQNGEIIFEKQIFVEA